MSGKASKMGKTLKKLLPFFQDSAITQTFWVKNVSLVHLYLNRRFMGGFYSAFGTKVKRFGCRRNAWFFKKN